MSLDFKAKQQITWQIDASDRIVGLCDNFPEFATENHNFHFSKGSIGLPLQEIVDCRQTQHLYRILLSRVRYHNQTLELPLRVENSEGRLWMTLKISRITGTENVQFEFRTTRHEHRRPLGVFHSDSKRSDDVIKICSMCNRLKTDSGWLDAEDACEELGLEDAEIVPKLINSLCKDCQLQAINATIGTSS